MSSLTEAHLITISRKATEYSTKNTIKNNYVFVSKIWFLNAFSPVPMLLCCFRVFDPHVLPASSELQHDFYMSLEERSA